MSSLELKIVPSGKIAKEPKLSSQNVHSNSSSEMMPKIRGDSAKKKLKSTCIVYLKSDASKTLIGNESALKKKSKICKESLMKKKEIAKSTYQNVNIHYKADSESNIEKTSTKRKLKNLELIPQTVHSRILSKSPHELIKATSVKRLKMSVSPSSNIITRSKSKTLVSPCSNKKITCSKTKTLKLKEVSYHKKTGKQAISAELKSEIQDNLVKSQYGKNVKKSKHLNSPVRIRNEYPAGLGAPGKKLHVQPKKYRRRVSSRSETFSQLNKPLIQVEEYLTSKLPLTESSTSDSEVKILKSVLLNDPVNSKNEIPDNLELIKNEKSSPFVLIEPMQDLHVETILTGEHLKAKNVEFTTVTKFEADLKGPDAELERKTNYYNLLALNDVNLVQNAELFECPLCFLDVDVGKGVTLQECLHNFCRICLADAIQISQTAAVKCPFESVEYSCESYLQEKEIKSLVEPEVYEQYLYRSVALAESQAQNSFHCKTLNCPGWCFYEDARDIFLCPVCHHFNCLFCAAIHEGKNCKEYQDDLKNLRYNNIKEVAKTKEYPKNEFQKVPEFETEPKKPEKTDYHDLLALNDINLVQNVEQIECPICFSDVGAGEGVILQECLHSFCRECLAGAIQFSETAVVKCPFRNDNYSCESHLQEREIKSLVTPEVYEKHLQRSVALAENQAQNSFHCKTPDCPGWCLFEDDVNTFLCPVCCHTNCLTCAVIHEGRNCKQYQDSLDFKCDSNEEVRKTKEYLQDKLDKGKAMKCPQCQIILMKKTGCDWFRCSMCHTEICWSTKGPRWGPRGYGDISGGCKCMVNDVRCHPHCKNCH